MEEVEFERPLTVRTIIEMMGAPKEHIDKVLKDYVEKLKKVEDFKIVKEKFTEPEEQGEYFSTFVELEIIFKDMLTILDFCFEAMPSSIEIIDPDHLSLPTSYFTDFLNDLQAKMHQMDMVVKQARAEKQHLDKNAVHVFRNFILYVLKDGPTDKDAIAEAVGTKAEQVKPFIDLLIAEDAIELVEGNKYRRRIEKNG